MLYFSPNNPVYLIDIRPDLPSVLAVADVKSLNPIWRTNTAPLCQEARNEHAPWEDNLYPFRDVVLSGHPRGVAIQSGPERLEIF